MTEGTSNDRAASADEEIAACLALGKTTSFFLFAGAGSGKTGSLVKALKRLRDDELGKHLRLRGQRVGVITYTNAACDEIKERTDFDALIEVSTIHSFMWSLIRGLNANIRQWLRTNLNVEIAELTQEIQKGRAGTKAAAERQKSLNSKQRRLADLDVIKRFIYNPNGDNRERDSLNHSEVIAIGADFLSTKPLMQALLVGRYPVLLVDESQDTNKLLMDALFDVQAKHKAGFCLGLFGDTMQRIYADGKLDLGTNLPEDWKKPAKMMNHRCPQRIVQLINRIRSAVDQHEQVHRDDKPGGVVRLFVQRSEIGDKRAFESRIAARMAEITEDTSWTFDYKSLILEHHMAARRLGFFELFDSFYKLETARTALLDGSLGGLQVFSRLVLPLVKAHRNGNAIAAAAIVRKHSPLLDRERLKALAAEQVHQLKKAREAAGVLMELFPAGGDPALMDVLRSLYKTELFAIPDALKALAAQIEDRPGQPQGDGTEEGKTSDTFEAWAAAVKVPFSQIEAYTDYVDQKALFDTHQGVKGREFPRVMVVMDDEEAKGFMFSYDKLFGVKAKSKTDIENERAGKETGVDRTRRLFYVTCSRALESLALVAYSSNPSGVRDHVIREGWFTDDEVVVA